MINDELRALFKGPVSLSIGTRDKDMNPEFVRCFGITAKSDNELTIMVPKVLAKQTLENIEDNKAIAFNVGDMSNFITRQFKGQAVSVQDASEEEIGIAKQNQETGGEIVRQFFGESAGDGWQKYIISPAVAVTMKITSVYDQTPRKGAGAKIS